MRNNRLFRLLDAELIDAQEDIRDLERTLKIRNEAREITNYVFRENSALLEQELHSLERIRLRLKDIDPEVHTDLTSYGNAVMEMVHDHVLHHGAPGAVESIVGRRLKKLTEFVDSTRETADSIR
jgi:hypothetical protein